MGNMNQESAVVVSTPANYSLEAYAHDLKAKLEVCKVMLQSGILPSYIKSEQTVFAIATRGAELGFSPFQSMQLFTWINGNVEPRARAYQAVATANGGTFKVLQWTDQICEIQATRKSNGWTETATFSIADAKRAELLGKDNWKKYPKDMLYARCMSILCRHGWSDKITGLSAEELADAVDESAPDAIVAEATRVADVITAAPATPPTEQEQNGITPELCFGYDVDKAKAACKKEPDEMKRAALVDRAAAIYTEVFKNGAGVIEGSILYCLYEIKEWDEFLIQRPKSIHGDDNIPGL